MNHTGKNQVIIQYIEYQPIYKQTQKYIHRYVEMSRRKNKEWTLK